MWYYIICAIVIILVWLLPILIGSKHIQNSIFAEFYASKFISNWLESLFMTIKYYQLKDFTELKSETATEKLKVLEVGVGEGTNFEHFPDNCSLTALDYNEYFEEKCTENVKMFRKIQFEKFVAGLVEDMHEFEDNSFDVVLCTHVLCSVDDVAQGLKEIKRVLKEGGKFFFIEHVAYQHTCIANKFLSMVQYMLAPMWKFVMCGCSVRKPTCMYLENAGFKTVTIKRVYPTNLPAIFRPHIWGCAVK